MPIFHVQSELLYGSIEQQTEVTISSYQSTSFYDPVAIYVDLCFSEDFSLAIFGIKSDEGCRYVLQIKIMLHIKNSSLISICIERALVNGLMLSWIHCKNDVTWQASLYWLEVGIDRRISSPSSMRLFSVC